MDSGARTIRWLVALALVAFGTVGCDGGNDHGAPPTLRIEVSDWNGWQRPDPDAEPQAKPYLLSGEEGEEIEFRLIDGELRITVEDRDDDSLTLRLDRPVAPRTAQGGLSLNDLEDSFTLEAGETVAFATPTMDAGTSVEVTWP